MKRFIETINEAKIIKKTVTELSKQLLYRAANTARDDAGHQRHVSKVAASRVGDPNHPPGQNLKSKRANYQAAKRDYQAFKFGVAAKKKEKKEKGGYREDLSIEEKYVIKHIKNKNRYLSNKAMDASNVKDALKFKSEKEAKNTLNGLDWQFRSNYEIVKEEVEFDEGIMDTAGFHNYPKRNKVGDEIEKIASKGGAGLLPHHHPADKFNLSKIASELQKGRIPHKFIRKLSPKAKKAVHNIMKDFGWKKLPEDKEVNEVPMKAIDEKMLADKFKEMNKVGDEIMKLAKKYKSFDLTIIASELRNGKIPKIKK